MWFKRRRNEFGCPMCGRLPKIVKSHTQDGDYIKSIYRLQCPRKHLSTNWYSDPMDASIQWKHVVGRIQEEGHEMSAYQPVLDPACGGRMVWFDKSDDRVLFGDVRDESWELCDGRRFDVKPDMLMDYRDLPFPDGTFRMVVLDPPHLRNAGETSYMAQKYGCLDQETWKADLKTMFSECFRVLKEHGVLIFKWNETQIPVSQILKLTAHKPLFGNKQPNRTGTHWIVFMKEDAK